MVALPHGAEYCLTNKDSQLDPLTRDRAPCPPPLRVNIGLGVDRQLVIRGNDNDRERSSRIVNDGWEVTAVETAIGQCGRK